MYRPGSPGSSKSIPSWTMTAISSSTVQQLVCGVGESDDFIVVPVVIVVPVDQVGWFRVRQAHQETVGHAPRQRRGKDDKPGRGFHGGP